MDPVRELRNRIHLNDCQIEQICQGAFVILKDNGALYNLWSKNGNVRLCSHTSSRPTMEILATKGVVLIGATVEGHTWFQWERSKCCSCSHVMDWMRYMYDYKNQGPEGESEHIQTHNPLVFVPLAI